MTANPSADSMVVTDARIKNYEAGLVGDIPDVKDFAGLLKV